LVATGINFSGDFYNIDKLKLRQLIHNCRQSAIDAEIPVNAQNDRESRWYLAKMAPRSRGDKYAWLDPSSAYINASSFHAMLDDLLAPFSPDEVDVVAGFDAAGFVLGAAMADRLGKGFLTIRKGGKIPVEFDVVDMSNYSGQTQHMEMRKPAFAPGTRVLLVDQWIETGGTMSAGISLVERQGGEIAGIAAVCIEDTEASREMRVKYKLSSCVVPGSAIQEQCDRQTLDSFATFSPEDCFPEIGKES
jgi:adenine phosphoribosyltransferase